MDPSRPTTGRLLVEGEHFCWTLEPPWQDNQTDISCIPCGTYDVKWLWSNHFKRFLPHIADVPGRQNIMIHALNQVSETEGCIGLGDKETGYTLFNSMDALNHFCDWFASVGNEATVSISRLADTAIF